jgi:hypothetical protein
MPRREFLQASAAALAPAPFMAAAQEDRLGQATLQVGHLTAVIGDNSADRVHRAGYNGAWSLRHAAGERSVFVPAAAGLNL